MKSALVLAGTLLLAGCASAPRPQMHLLAPKAPIVKAAPASAVVAPATTPNAVVKKRWYDRFKTHPKFFH